MDELRDQPGSPLGESCDPPGQNLGNAAAAARGSDEPRGKDDPVFRIASTSEVTLRMKNDIGEYASGLKNNGVDNWATKTTYRFFGNPPEFNAQAWRRMTIGQKEEHRNKKQLLENLTQITRRAEVAWEKGSFVGLAAHRTRSDGAGRVTKRAGVSEALYEWYLDMYLGNQARVSVEMVVAKLKCIATKMHAAEETDESRSAVAAFFDKDGVLAIERLQRWVSDSWVKQHNLKLKQSSRSYKLSEEETLERLGCFWRNCVRVLHFLGDDVEVDGFDQTPFYRRMNDKRSLHPGGGTLRRQRNQLRTPETASP